MRKIVNPVKCGWQDEQQGKQVKSVIRSVKHDQTENGKTSIAKNTGFFFSSSDAQRCSGTLCTSLVGQQQSF
jgi:hypothetical protein